MKKFINKYKNYILSFMIPVIILIISFGIIGYYPFGDKLVAIIDGYSQYPGLLSNFLNTIKGNNNLFYSFKGLLGFNSYANMVYYSFNITNIIALFFRNLMAYYNIIIIIKIGLCSLTMTMFLDYIRKRKVNYMFGICYGLSAYNLLYYFNFMWFDTVILLPLVILGIEKIFKEDKYNFYLIILTLSIIFNFYIGYMVCIFSLIYFIYLTFTKGFSKSRIIKYIVYSLFAGLLSAFALLPAILEIFNGKIDVISDAYKDYFMFDKDFINVFYKLSLASFSNGDLEYGTPNVFVSIFVYINAILYFFNNRIKLKTRLISLGIVFFFLLSMSFNFLDYFWHMMSKPIYYPVRYSFIFDFYLIYLGFRNYIRYDKKGLKFNIIFYISLIVLLFIGFITSGNLIDKENLLVKIIYLGVSIVIILYYAFILNNKEFKRFISIILIIELSFNTFLSLRNVSSITSFKEYTSRYNLVLDQIKNIDNEDIYRIGVDKKSTNNNGLLVGYNDLSYFSSIRNTKVLKYLKYVLNIRVIDDCNLLYAYNNPIVNSLLNIKYVITNNNLNYYEKIDDYLYKNNDATSIGFMTNKNILSLKVNEEDTIFNFNNLIKTINNKNDNILKLIEPKYSSFSCDKNNNVCIFNGTNHFIEYNYTSTTDELIFINDINFKISKYSFMINDNNTSLSNNDFYLLHKGDNIKITVDSNDDNNIKDYNISLYSINYDKYKSFVDTINNNKFEITNYLSDSNFIGKVNVDEDNTLLYTSISADNGWNVFVDGKKTSYIKIYDAVIGLELPDGEHEIEFKYTTPGLKQGLFVSLFTLLIVISINIVNKKNKEFD